MSKSPWILLPSELGRLEAYAVANGWIRQASPPKAQYEALRLVHPDRSVPALFYRRNKKTKISFNSIGEELAREWGKARP